MSALCECGAPVRGLACQRGHRIEEVWSPEARAAAIAARERNRGASFHALGPGEKRWEPKPSGIEHEFGSGRRLDRKPPGGPAEPAHGSFDGKWQSPPGGKVYEATHAGHHVKIVKQNTAAGGPRYKAYHTPPSGDPVRVVAKHDSLAAVKQMAAQHFPAGAASQPAPPVTGSFKARPPQALRQRGQ